MTKCPSLCSGMKVRKEERKKVKRVAMEEEEKNCLMGNRR